jgi:membrane-associated phospholipid phosphatase
MDSFVHAWETGRDWANRVAAMPSLHAAFSLLVVVFFFPWVRAWWWRAVLLAYPLVMGVALVYLGEHYVVDVLAGWVLVGLAFVLWGWIERRGRLRRADISRSALASDDAGGHIDAAAQTDTFAQIDDGADRSGVAPS